MRIEWGAAGGRMRSPADGAAGKARRLWPSHSGAQSIQALQDRRGKQKLGLTVVVHEQDAAAARAAVVRARGTADGALAAQSHRRKLIGSLQRQRLLLVR